MVLEKSQTEYKLKYMHETKLTFKKIMQKVWLKQLIIQTFFPNNKNLKHKLLSENRKLDNLRDDKHFSTKPTLESWNVLTYLNALLQKQHVNPIHVERKIVSV